MSDDAINRFAESYLDGVGAFDGSNDEPRDRAYVLSGLRELLAAERAKARAVFLALADELADEANNSTEIVGRLSFRAAANLIRRAAEEQQ